MGLTRIGAQTTQAGRINSAGLDDLLRRLALDAVVCRAGVNVAYLSGMRWPGTLGRHLDLADSPRPAFIVWPSVGEPVLIVSRIASDLARATSMVGGLIVYEDYSESAEGTLAGALVDLGLDRSRIGFDLPSFGAAQWASIVRMRPKLSAVDCTHELDLVRAIKTAEEVGQLRSAAARLDQAFLDVFSGLRPGQSERQGHSMLVSSALQAGLDNVHGIFQTSSNPVLYGGEGDALLRSGDLVRTDYVAYLGGYAANLSRLLHVGRPPEAVRRQFHTYLEVNRAAVELLRPGSTGGEIHSAIGNLFERRGWASGPPIGGHGVGSWFHQQPPLFVKGSRDALRPGMVVALEPISGPWHLQDEFLITTGHPERISSLYPIEELRWID